MILVIIKLEVCVVVFFFYICDLILSEKYSNEIIEGTKSHRFDSVNKDRLITET